MARHPPAAEETARAGRQARAPHRERSSSGGWTLRRVYVAQGRIRAVAARIEGRTQRPPSFASTTRLRPGDAERIRVAGLERVAQQGAEGWDHPAGPSPVAQERR